MKIPYAIFLFLALIHRVSTVEAALISPAWEVGEKIQANTFAANMHGQLVAIQSSIEKVKEKGIDEVRREIKGMMEILSGGGEGARPATEQEMKLFMAFSSFMIDLFQGWDLKSLEINMMDHLRMDQTPNHHFLHELFWEKSKNYRTCIGGMLGYGCLYPKYNLDERQKKLLKEISDMIEKVRDRTRIKQRMSSIMGAIYESNEQERKKKGNLSLQEKSQEERFVQINFRLSDYIITNPNESFF